MSTITLSVPLTITSCWDDDDDDLVLSQSSIAGHWSNGTDDYQELIYIGSDGVIGYQYDNLEDRNDWIYIDAGGTYTIDGNVITAIYNVVDVGGWSGNITKTVMGFTNKKTTTIKYTITDYTNDSMTIKNDITGKTAKYFKY